jgi:hypothetical protein
MLVCVTTWPIRSERLAVSLVVPLRWIVPCAYSSIATTAGNFTGGAFLLTCPFYGSHWLADFATLHKKATQFGV